MSVEFPQIDQIMHSSLDKDAYTQREYVKLMNQSSNFINLSFEDLIDRITREYNHESIVNILERVNSVIVEENDTFPIKIVYDDFVRNAKIVSQALRKIIIAPSTKLVKINKNVQSNKVTRFDSKTMIWIARRSGANIAEKISPKNVIPTKVTSFSTDTPENRHTLYLFDILYDYLYEKIYPNGLDQKLDIDEYSALKSFELYDKIRSILTLKQKIKQSDLNNVIKQKQTKQNNKLLADKEYKQIWDAVKEVDYYEQNVQNIWNHLKERYQFIAFLFVCAKISTLENTMIFDEQSQLTDQDGIIFIKSGDGYNRVRFYDKEKSNEIIISLVKESIKVDINRYETSNNVVYSKVNVYSHLYDMSKIFDEFEIIKQKELEYKKQLIALETHNNKLRETNDKLIDFEDRIKLIESLVSLLIELKKVDKTDA
jgi:hypothetical protein